MITLLVLILIFQLLQAIATLAVWERARHQKIQVHLPAGADLTGVFTTPEPHAPLHIFHLMDEGGVKELHEITKHTSDVPETYSYAGQQFTRIGAGQSDGSYTYVRVARAGR